MIEGGKLGKERETLQKKQTENIKSLVNHDKFKCRNRKVEPLN